METIVAAFILTFILSAFLVLVFRNRKCRTGMEPRVRYVPLFLTMDAAVVCADIFAGGDVVTGAATVILAMGAGRKAAAAIDKYLKTS